MTELSFPLHPEILAMSDEETPGFSQRSDL